MSRSYRMLPLAQLVPALPGFAFPKTYAAWPVWRDSTTAEVRFAPLPKKQAVRLFHKARDFERQTRQRGRQDGALGRNGLAVLHALLFDFINYITGQLDPAQETIAGKDTKVHRLSGSVERPGNVHINQAGSRRAALAEHAAASRYRALS